MIDHQSWMKRAPQLLLEWKQTQEEGRQVEDLQQICTYISERPWQEDWEQEAAAVVEKLHNAPMQPDYAYSEPSTLHEITAELPATRHTFSATMSPENRRDKLVGAWRGRIAGCLLGKPVEGFRRDRLLPLLQETNNYPMKHYVLSDTFTDEMVERLTIDRDLCWADHLNGCAPVDDDTNYTVLALKLVEQYGRDFDANRVLEAWLLWLPMLTTYTAERAAYRNAAMGLLAPQTATNHNPYREWIGAQIRADFYGYIHPGQPRAAAEMAWRDASVSHVKNGIYGAIFVAAMLAAAAVCDDKRIVIEAGLDEIPEKCRLRSEIERVIAWYNEGTPVETVIEHIHTAYDEHDQHGWCHTISNAMIVVMGILYGEGDFGRSICLAVQAAFDTDCNGATVGSIVGMMHGAKVVGEAWTAPFADAVETSIDGCPHMTVQELVDRTMAV